MTKPWRHDLESERRVVEKLLEFHESHAPPLDPPLQAMRQNLAAIDHDEGNCAEARNLTALVISILEDEDLRKYIL